MNLRTCVAVTGALLAWAPQLAHSQDAVISAAPSGDVAQAFKRLAPAVVRIEVRETGAVALSSVGSGFFAAPSGRIITNYHVISRLVNEPGRHKGRATWGSDTVDIRVLAVDVVHDLAVLEAPDAHGTVMLTPVSASLSKGDRVLALGHPRDLGLSIVEGTYNGQVEHVLTPRLHFTGPLNPGMSGGPAVTPMGELVGVNVATMGEELAFLVPAEFVSRLLGRLPTVLPVPSTLRSDMAAQIGTLGVDALDSLFVPGAPTVQLGPYRAPTEPSAAFQCWGDAREPKDAAYRLVVHRCSTDESVYLSEDLSAGLVYFSHQLLDGEALSRIRLLTATEQVFNDKLAFDGTPRETTRFRCTTSNVRTSALTFRTELCARRLKTLDGLYEAVLRATPLGATAHSLVTTLTMSGLRFGLIQRLVERYLASITPAPEVGE
jgi:S1-C subfamily serine protease